MNKLSVASAHGRFQPLHKGHMEYLMAAKEKCEFLWVGITQYNIRLLQGSPSDPHRELPQDNPLTYFERVELISSALLDAGLQRDEFGLLPFPIEAPDQLSDFLPIDIPVFTTIYDEWNRHKINLLRDAGYTVIVLWERDHKQFKGSDVRNGILQDNHTWIDLVPTATVRAVYKHKLRDRLLKLADQSR